MEDFLHTITGSDQNKDYIDRNQLIKSLENGKILYFPDQYLIPNNNEKYLLVENILDKNSKNISYDYTSGKIGGINKLSPHVSGVAAFMHKYALYSKQLIDVFLPHYSANIIWGRTSFRPAEIKGRKSSKRKDDTRVHVDSFPATPVEGKRILRVFCNVNPNGIPRVWHVGEPFNELVIKFKDKIPAYNNFKANILKIFKVTKKKRTAYDHYMLNLHDRMKLDDKYQSELDKKTIEFPANSTWIVFTDNVSHAALSGQFLLEQTFYLNVEHMDNHSLAPLSHWQNTGLI